MQIARVAIRVVVDVVVPRQRKAGLVLVGGAESPAAEHCIGERSPPRAPSLLTPERQVDDGAERGAVRTVIRRDAVFELTVRRIEEVEPIGFVRTRVRCDQRIVAAEALLNDDRASLIVIGSAVLLGDDALELGERAEKL